jgi:hypothetical protein
VVSKVVGRHGGALFSRTGEVADTGRDASASILILLLLEWVLTVYVLVSCSHMPCCFSET